jgi:hypothetical protein
MDDRPGESKFKWQDACGIVGVILAVAAMTDMPIVLRLICFSLCAVCLPISFFSHKNWPLWMRWFGSVVVVVLMVYVGWNAWASSRPKIVKDVYIEWPQPAPMELGTSLNEHQLDAVAKSEGFEVPGRYSYNPALGTTLPAGMDTLSVEFTPLDQSKYKSVKQTLAVFVKDHTIPGPATQHRVENPPKKQNGEIAGDGESSAPPSGAPSQVITAPNGIAIGGGTVTNPTVNNNYHNPPPANFSFTEDLRPSFTMGGKFNPPLLTVSITTDRQVVGAEVEIVFSDPVLIPPDLPTDNESNPFMETNEPGMSGDSFSGGVILRNGIGNAVRFRVIEPTVFRPGMTLKTRVVQGKGAGAGQLHVIKVCNVSLEAKCD